MSLERKITCAGANPSAGFLLCVFLCVLCVSAVKQLWRLQRCWSCEAALIDNQMDHQASELAEKYESVDEPTRQALALRALSDQSQSFELFGRRESRLRNFFSRALRELQKLQVLRRAPTPPPSAIGIEKTPEIAFCTNRPLSSKLGFELPQGVGQQNQPSP